MKLPLRRLKSFVIGEDHTNGFFNKVSKFRNKFLDKG